MTGLDRIDELMSAARRTPRPGEQMWVSPRDISDRDWAAMWLTDDVRPSRRGPSLFDQVPDPDSFPMLRG